MKINRIFKNSNMLKITHTSNDHRQELLLLDNSFLDHVLGIFFQPFHVLFRFLKKITHFLSVIFLRFNPFYEGELPTICYTNAKEAINTVEVQKGKIAIAKLLETEMIDHQFYFVYFHIDVLSFKCMHISFLRYPRKKLVDISEVLWKIGCCWE